VQQKRDGEQKSSHEGADLEAEATGVEAEASLSATYRQCLASQQSDVAKVERRLRQMLDRSSVHPRIMEFIEAAQKLQQSFESVAGMFQLIEDQESPVPSPVIEGFLAADALVRERAEEFGDMVTQIVSLSAFQASLAIGAFHHRRLIQQVTQAIMGADNINLSDEVELEHNASPNETVTKSEPQWPVIAAALRDAAGDHEEFHSVMSALLPELHPFFHDRVRALGKLAIITQQLSELRSQWTNEVRSALDAGASWANIGRVSDSDPVAARRKYERDTKKE
jgi:hypothetical protein